MPAATPSLGTEEVGSGGVAPVPGETDPVVPGRASTSSTTPVRGRWWRLRTGLALVYVVTYVVWFLNLGLIIDRISVLISIALLLVIATVGKPLRAWRVLAIDFVLYAAMWIAYDETRGAADRIGRPLQVESVRDIDRFLFGGVDPTVWMQRRFFSPEHVRWYDVVASVVYYSHFIVPVALIAFLWVRHRRQWVRFMRRFATVLAIACMSFVLLPTAPPWMAAGGSETIVLDALPPLERPAGRGWDALHLDSFVHAWETGRDWANPIAALPSLHASFALLGVAFCLPYVRRRWIRAALLVYPLAMGVTLVYLAEHWVVDVLAGWVVVGCSFAVWGWIERRLARRAIAVVDDVRPGEAVAIAPPDHEGVREWMHQPV
jgi:membrane-associated phospholipid phosphatase